MDFSIKPSGIFDKIGSGRINQTEIAFFSVVFSIPFPFVWVASLWFMKNSSAVAGLNLEYVDFYFLVAPFLSLIFVTLAICGFFLYRREQQSEVYVHAVVQSITIITFIMSAFFGFFTTPVSLAIVAAVGIASIIFDKSTVMWGLLTLSILIVATAVLHANGLPIVPIAKSLSHFEGVLLPWVTIIFLLASIFFILIFYFFVSTLMENSRQKQVLLESLSGKLARYLSPQIYDSIFSGEKEVKIETYRKKLTVFFSDIKSFTEITDGMESEALSVLLNNYLNEMSTIALKHGGTIDKFIGDAIMIFFGDPESQGEEQDALNCVTMAIDMRERMKELQASWYRQGISDPLEIRIGINTGFCTVGNFGADDRLDYTVVGSQVNVAGELESQAKPNSILISQQTYDLVKERVECLSKSDIDIEESDNAFATYEVRDFYDNSRSADEGLLLEKLDKFLTEVEFNGMDESEKSFVLNSIQNLT